MMRDLLRRWRHLRWCPVLLLHELGAVQDNNARHRRKLRREPILSCAIDTAPEPFIGKATPSPARQNGWRERIDEDDPAARLTPPLDQRTIGADHLWVRWSTSCETLPAPLVAGFFLSSQAAAPAARSQQPAAWDRRGWQARQEIGRAHV